MLHAHNTGAIQIALNLSKQSNLQLVRLNLQLADISTNALAKGHKSVFVHKLVLLWNTIAILERVTIFCIL